jgi:hypothetical protein
MVSRQVIKCGIGNERAIARVSDATGNCNAFLLPKALSSHNLESALNAGDRRRALHRWCGLFFAIHRHIWNALPGRAFRNVV